MRIIAGIAKGRKLRVPQCAATRPATDLVRSAIFSMLDSMDADWTRVLDLFAGSGAIGLEALSRGAGWVDFVEQNRDCCAIIKQNAESMRLSDKMHVYCVKVPNVLFTLSNTYGLIFLDPPYADESLSSVVEKIADSALIQEQTVVTALHSARRPMNEGFGRLRRIKERRHGDTTISLYKQEALS